jgi:dUTP pyrophosphatase
MRIQSLHNGFIMPTKGTDQAGAFDIYMPESGSVGIRTKIIGLGFAAEVPENHVALLLPRSSSGGKFGLELNNTCGVIDADYRGEWKAVLRTKDGELYCWSEGDRLLQFLIVPVAQVRLELVGSVSKTIRGTGGFGSSGS